jgi:hypothetical protein
MKQLALLFAVSTSLTLTAITTTSAQGNSRVNIMKKDGKVIEVVNGKQEAVTHDITLPNHATVHGDGSIDDIDGNKKQLNEGEYISFVDGRIRKLSASPAAAPATTTTKPVAPATKKPASKS